jgi:hypothetical protein
LERKKTLSEPLNEALELEAAGKPSGPDKRRLGSSGRVSPPQCNEENTDGLRVGDVGAPALLREFPHELDEEEDNRRRMRNDRRWRNDRELAKRGDR